MTIIINIVAYILTLQTFGFVFAVEYCAKKKNIKRALKFFINLGELIFAIVLVAFPSWLISINYNINWDNTLWIMVILAILIAKIAVRILLKFDIKILDLE